MDRLHCMKVIVSVADLGGFTSAAKRLGISAAAASRAVAHLEEVTGARLFVRSTRSVKLSDSGRNYVEDCRRILTEIEEAEASAGGAHASASGVLTITAPVLFGQIHVMPIVTAFLAANPSISARVLLFDRIVNLVDEGIDVAIRIGHLADSNLNAIRVGHVHRVVCGAPSYFKRHGVPRKPSDLAKHKVIAITSSSAPVDWRFGDDGNEGIAFHPRLYCNTVDAAIAAATEGWGLARPLSYQVVRLVKDGSLRIVLEKFEGQPLPIHLVHPEGRRVSARTRAFVDFAVTRLRAAAPNLSN